MNEGQDFLAEAERVRQEQVGRADRSEVDPAVQAAVDHAASTPASPAPEPRLKDIGGLSAGEVAAQQEDIARQSYAASPTQGQAEGQLNTGTLVGRGDELLDEAERVGNAEDFMADASKVRQEQLGGSGAPAVDPAVQAAVDHAASTPAQPAPEPRLKDIGGLSAGEVAAQQEEIARERYRGGA